MRKLNCGRSLPFPVTFPSDSFFIYHVNGVRISLLHILECVEIFSTAMDDADGVNTEATEIS